jgi:hypothetical protein
VTTLADLTVLDISAATGNPAVDTAAVRAKLSVLRATVWPANTDRVGIAAELRRLARDPRHAAHASALYATARVVRGRPCPR